MGVNGVKSGEGNSRGVARQDGNYLARVAAIGWPELYLLYIQVPLPPRNLIASSSPINRTRRQSAHPIATRDGQREVDIKSIDERCLITVVACFD